VSSLSRILSLTLHIFHNFSHSVLLLLLNRSNLGHDILEQVLDQHLCVLVALQPLVNFHLDHVRKLVCHLNLLALEPVNLVANSITNLGDFTTKCDLLLCSRKLFLLYPAVDAPDLTLKGGLKLGEHLVFPLELSADHLVHLDVPVAEFITLVTTLLLTHLLLHVHLVANVIKLSGSLISLSEQSVDQICHLDL